MWARAFIVVSIARNEQGRVNRLVEELANWSNLNKLWGPGVVSV